MNTYLDTSVLVSLYTPDANSATAARQVSMIRGTILITAFLELELVNAIELRVFRREIRRSQADAATAALSTDLQNGVYSPVPLPAAAYTRARQLARKYTAATGARTLDLLHVASALTLGADVLYSFDQRQCRVAEAAGLAISSLK